MFSDNLPFIVSRYLELESVAQEIRSPTPRDRCRHGAPRHRFIALHLFGSIQSAFFLADQASLPARSAAACGKPIAAAFDHGPLGRQWH
jgi:hypothetical protein